MSEGIGLSKKRPRTCDRCGVVFEATKASARYCSEACRKAASRFGRTYGQYDTAHREKVWHW